MLFLLIVYETFLLHGCFLLGSCIGSPKGVAGGGAIELVSKKGSITIGNNLFS